MRHWRFIFILFTLYGNVPTFAKPDSYRIIDRHALSAPVSAERSVRSLAEYLIRPARNDEEKVRAIFRWIAQNITYDTRSYFTGDIQKVESNDVLKSRTAVCDGFAGLFQSLGKEAGLKIENIQGYAKGYDYRIGKHFRGPANHAWNAVLLNGSWKLLDATWGAGYMDEKGRFVREFDGHFFLTPPEEMIYTHFPEDPKWQLLADPISIEEFERRVYLKPAFFRYGLALQSHREGFIETQDAVTVILSSPESAALSAQILRSQHVLNETLTFIQHRSGEQIVRAAFPSPGTYTLRLFVKGKDDPGLYEWAMDYLVHATSPARDPVGFPEVYKAFEERDCFLFGPMNGRLKAGREYIFSALIPDAEKAVLIVGDRWIELMKNEDVFESRVVASKGVVQLAALFPGNSQYSVLLKYIGYE